MKQHDEWELIQAGADGELDEAARARLDALLAHSEKAREQHTTLLRLNNFLGQVPPVEPPDELHDRIVSGIALPSPARRGLGDFFDFIPGLLRYGLAAGLAVVITMAVYQGGSQLDGVDYNKLVGTMSARGTERDRFEFRQAGAQGSVRLLERGETFALEFELNAEGPVHFDVNFADSGLRFDAFAQADLNLDQVSLTKTSLSGLAEGSQRFVVLMRPDGTAEPANAHISLELNRGEKLLGRGTLTTHPAH